MMRLTARRVLRSAAAARVSAAAAQRPQHPARGMAYAAAAATPSHSKAGAKTGIVLLNMGGPPELKEVNPFLRRLFTDPDIIPLGRYQESIGRFMARRRTPKIEAQYAAIGGGSPIAHWTHAQGEQFIRKLSQLCGAPTAAAASADVSANALFNYYISFRYAPPLTETALLRMKADGVTRAIAFSQYPQWSCTTTGSSLNHLWSEVERLGLTRQFQWSVIDRWHNHPLYIKAVVQRIREAMSAAQRAAADSGDRAPLRPDELMVVFSAHSVPMKVVYKGDQYVTEIFGTAELVMAELQRQLKAEAAATAGVSGGGGATVRGEYAAPPYVVSWQSKVGYLPWMGPSTVDTVTRFVARHAVPAAAAPAAASNGGSGGDSASALPLRSTQQRARAMLLVPIAFTSDHIETLFELDIEAKRLFEEANAKARAAAGAGADALPRLHFVRAPSLNESELLTDAQSQIVFEHLRQTQSLPAAAAAAAAGGLGSVLPRAVHYSAQYPLRCGGCVNPRCRSVINPVPLSTA